MCINHCKKKKLQVNKSITVLKFCCSERSIIQLQFKNQCKMLVSLMWWQTIKKVLLLQLPKSNNIFRGPLNQVLLCLLLYDFNKNSEINLIIHSGRSVYWKMIDILIKQLTLDKSVKRLSLPSRTHLYRPVKSLFHCISVCIFEPNRMG